MISNLRCKFSIISDILSKANNNNKKESDIKVNNIEINEQCTMLNIQDVTIDYPQDNKSPCTNTANLHIH